MSEVKTLDQNAGLDKIFGVAAVLVAIVLTIFHLLAASPLLTLNNTTQAVIHGALIVSFFLLMRPMKKLGAASRVLDVAMIVITALAAHQVVVMRNSNTASGAANVVTTGTFTIPLMKKTGFDSDTAGAVEACASNGGQIMPPVMGAVAFLMADATGLSYTTICLAALFPAVLYYITLSTSIFSYAHAHNIPVKEPDPNAKSVGEIFKGGWFYFAPITALSGGDMWKTGLQAIKMAAAGFVIPFIFLYNTDLLCFDAAAGTFGITPAVILSVCTAAIGCAFMAIALFGWLFRDLKTPERVLLLACGVLLMLNEPFILNVVGLVLGIAILAMVKLSNKKGATV